LAAVHIKYVAEKIDMPSSNHLSLQPSPATQTWLTVTEAAAHLKIKQRTLLRWVNDGKVPAYA